MYEYLFKMCICVCVCLCVYEKQNRSDSIGNRLQCGYAKFMIERKTKKNERLFSHIGVADKQ